MVSLQIISKILATKDSSILEDNLLTRDYFVGYENEYDFLVQHEKDYGDVPDKATFLSKFPDVELVEVTDVFIGDPMAYSGYEVLVIVAKGNGLIGFKMEYADNFVPAVDEEFFIEIGIDEEYEGAIEISDGECNPVGFVEVI